MQIRTNCSFNRRFVVITEIIRGKKNRLFLFPLISIKKSNIGFKRIKEFTYDLSNERKRNLKLLK